ncbi:unnamed protein product [[Candida] boidinii]|uniref:Unnamed protein product n=1 Tax=Candida boidinii TaxID=5477 RepID=A0A9W6SUK8_CANBO|nr:hypothetical protein B5S30_g2757 [[Candida] boidinii]GME66729.1 unnamed protein product [[Candida] boidinii]
MPASIVGQEKKGDTDNQEEYLSSSSNESSGFNSRYTSFYSPEQVSQETNKQIFSTRKFAEFYENISYRFNRFLKRKQFSLFQCYILLVLVFLLPLTFYVETSLLIDKDYDVTLQNEDSYQKLKRLNSKFLPNIILPANFRDYEDFRTYAAFIGKDTKEIVYPSDTEYKNSKVYQEYQKRLSKVSQAVNAASHNSKGYSMNFDKNDKESKMKFDVTDPLVTDIEPLGDDLESLRDPRLATALWLKLLEHHLLENNGILDPNFQIPFSWNDWANLGDKLNPIPTYVRKINTNFGKGGNLPEGQVDLLDLTCKEFKEYYKIDKEEFDIKCTDMSNTERAENPRYPYQFKILDQLVGNFYFETRILWGASYVYNSLPPPRKVQFLGAGLGGSSVAILTERDKLGRHPVISKRSGNLKDFYYKVVEKEAELQHKSVKEILEQELRLNDIVYQLRDTYSNDSIRQNIANERELEIEQSYLCQVDKNVQVLTPVMLTKDDFLWDTESKLNEIKQRIEKLEKKANYNEYRSLDSILLKSMEIAIDMETNREEGLPKFLDEAVETSGQGYHYDWRFFSGIHFTEDYRKANIARMGRAWLRFCNSSGIRSWIAFGSMLGWYRNGLMLPWDNDIDVQVTVESLYHLGRVHNTTLIVDVSVEDSYASGINSYYLDIGGSFYSRRRGNGANSIDGRFIDTVSGSYIDITALAYTPDEKPGFDDNFRRIVDKNFDSRRDGDDKEDYYKELDEKMEATFKAQEIYHCRNNQYFSFEELSPMVPTFFEGVRAIVPHDSEKILRRKYPGALDRNSEPNHLYKPYIRLWVKEGDCPGNDKDGEFCRDDSVVEEYARTREYTKRHVRIMKDPMNLQLRVEEESVPMRYDSFMVDYAHRLNANLD